MKRRFKKAPCGHKWLEELTMHINALFNFYNMVLGERSFFIAPTIDIPFLSRLKMRLILYITQSMVIFSIF